MSNSSMNKVGGNCAILAGISYVVVGVAYFMHPKAQLPGSPVAELLPSVAEGFGAATAEYLAFAIGAFLAIAVVLAVSDLVRPASEGLVRWTGTLAIIGFAVLGVQDLLMQAHTPVLAEAYMKLDAGGKAAVEAVGTRYLDAYGLLGFGLPGLWMLVVNVLAMRGGLWPKALAWIGVLGGVAYLLVVAGFVFNVTALVGVAAGLGGVIAGPIWYIWIGIHLKGLRAEA